LSAARAGALALALTAFAAIAMVPQANAAFTTPQCGGLSISGEGGSFAKDAHAVFNFNFKNSFCPGTTKNVSYAPNGSGAGVKSVTLRTLAPRFGQTDDPPTPEQVALMNAGAVVDPGAGKAVTEADSDPANDGKIHVVPSAVGAVVALVNLPEGCSAELINDNEYRTLSMAEIASEPSKKGILRIRFPKATYEKIWAQGGAGSPAAPYVKWSDVIPGFSGQAACEKPIIRVVRFDQSGTTFTLKDYLNSLNASREWKTKYATTGPNLTREWPGATFGDRDDCGDNDGVAEASDPDGPGAPGFDGTPGVPADTDNLTSACGNGNGNLLDTLIATDGSIGYADIATARAKGATVNPAGATPPTSPYWTQVQNGSNAFTEPTATATAFQSNTVTGEKGANCKQATFTAVPTTPESDPTLGDWSQTSGVNSANGYGICTLTYGLVFDDNAAVWGNTAEEEQKARTVKDYWENALSDVTQGQLFPSDYAPLPPAILSIARTGIAAVDWNKSSGGGGGNGGGGNGGGGGGSTTPDVVKPSNLFSVPRKSISSKTGGASISVKLPGAGKLELDATAKAGKKRIKVGRIVLNANKAGTFQLSLKPSGAAKSQLRKKGRLKVSLQLTFTPTGGDSSTQSSSITLKLKKKRK
jgi:ABC-type phosphate transport system substrate-binding protein